MNGGEAVGEPEKNTCINDDMLGSSFIVDVPDSMTMSQVCE